MYQTLLPAETIMSHWEQIATFKGLTLLKNKRLRHRNSKSKLIKPCSKYFGDPDEND